MSRRTEQFLFHNSHPHLVVHSIVVILRAGVLLWSDIYTTSTTTTTTATPAVVAVTPVIAVVSIASVIVAVLLWINFNPQIVLTTIQNKKLKLKYLLDPIQMTETSFVLLSRFH